LIGGGAGRALFRHIGLEPRDLLIEERDAGGKLLDREQGQVLADLVSDLLLRPIILVHRRHHRTSLESQAKPKSAPACCHTARRPLNRAALSA
jgi:hypothetical protein